MVLKLVLLLEFTWEHALGTINCFVCPIYRASSWTLPFDWSTLLFVQFYKRRVSIWKKV